METAAVVMEGWGVRLHLCGCMRGTVYSIGGLVVWLASGSALAAQTHTPTLSFSANAGVRSTAMPRGIADRFLFGGFIDSTEVTQWIDRTHEAPGGWMRAGGIARAELEFDSGKRWAVRANGWSIVDVQATAGAVEAAATRACIGDRAAAVPLQPWPSRRQPAIQGPATKQRGEGRQSTRRPSPNLSPNLPSVTLESRLLWQP